MGSWALNLWDWQSIYFLQKLLIFPIVLKVAIIKPLDSCKWGCRSIYIWLQSRKARPDIFKTSKISNAKIDFQIGRWPVRNSEIHSRSRDMLPVWSIHSIYDYIVIWKMLENTLQPEKSIECVPNCRLLRTCLFTHIWIYRKFRVSASFSALPICFSRQKYFGQNSEMVYTEELWLRMTRSIVGDNSLALPHRRTLHSDLF